MATFRGASDIARYIVQNYSGLVIEIGIGYMPDVAMILLNEPSILIMATDKKERKFGKLVVHQEDIFSPDTIFYLGASLLYSIRPTLEMQLAIGLLASFLEADILIRPLGEEIAELPGFICCLKNQGEAKFYIYKAI